MACEVIQKLRGGVQCTMGVGGVDSNDDECGDSRFVDDNDSDM